jgi:hypothetical protein
MRSALTNSSYKKLIIRVTAQAHWTQSKWLHKQRREWNIGAVPRKSYRAVRYGQFKRSVCRNHCRLTVTHIARRFVWNKVRYTIHGEINSHAIQTWAMPVKLHAFSLALDGDKWPASRFRHSIPGKCLLEGKLRGPQSLRNTLVRRGTRCRLFLWQIKRLLYSGSGK